MKEELVNLRNDFFALVIDVRDLSELENIRIAYLGRNGKISGSIKKIKEISVKERGEFGRLVNETKSTIEEEIRIKYAQLVEDKKTRFDPTVPGLKQQAGHLHLITQAKEDISKIFLSQGFTRSRYPEVEWDWYSFGSLNFSPDHPARDDWETYWIDTPKHKEYGPMLLTPHTSSGQLREMERVGKPPIRMINIAKCYRRQSDVSHTPMFHQFEGLVIDKGISISHLKGTLDYFAKKYFGENRVTRLRPHNFPFTEPSFEVDISCDICDGKGCRLCKDGWLELAGAGMVHPNVLKNGQLDPNEYTGFAFGVGVERVLMMRSGLKVDDLRTLYSTDIRYLTQF